MRLSEEIEGNSFADDLLPELQPTVKLLTHWQEWLILSQDHVQRRSRPINLSAAKILVSSYPSQCIGEVRESFSKGR